MKTFNPAYGISTISSHALYGDVPVISHVPPIHQTSTFVFPDVSTAQKLFSKEQEGYIYTRWDNPNQNQLAQKIAHLEGLDLLRANQGAASERLVSATMFSSGMAAISAVIFAILRPGDTVIAQRSLYGGTFDLLSGITKQYGINTHWVENEEIHTWELAARHSKGQKLLIAETPANPLLAVLDLSAIAQVAHQAGSWLMVDNTFASPFCQRPLSFGADIVVHSTTKYLSGHGQVIGGVVVSRHPDFMQEKLQPILRLLGCSPSPFDCWLTDSGLRTFELRMERHCQNALKVAEYLSGHPRVAKVFFPGLKDHPGYPLAMRQMNRFGGMVSFELKGGYQAGVAMLNDLKLITLAVSLGTVDSLICHPASMTHAGVPLDVRKKMGITDGLIRLSVGIENIEDILSDLDLALA